MTRSLRAPLESALSGRRGELTSSKSLFDGISMINAQLEDAESLLSGLRGELLALDTSVAPGSHEPDLAQLKSRVAYFRQSMDEVARSVETLPAATTERLHLDERGTPRCAESSEQRCRISRPGGCEDDRGELPCSSKKSDPRAPQGGRSPP